MAADAVEKRPNLLVGLLVCSFFASCLGAPKVEQLPLPYSPKNNIRQLGRDNAPMAFVEAGAFVRGINQRQERRAFELCEEFAPGNCDMDWFAAEKPQREITLDAFWIDVFEVTNVQYDRCVREGSCAPPDHSDCQAWDSEEGDWRALSPPEVRTNFSDPEKPVVCVDWIEAETYCRWAGKSLPSEAQWEKAARGTDQRTFPWGEQTPNCVMSQMTSPENGGEGCGDHSTAAVGGRAAALSPYGAQDMSGNALEWTLDFLNPEFYATGPATNPINREPSQRRVIRGGAWNNEPAFLRTTTRGSFPADFRTVYTSFRCAM